MRLCLASHTSRDAQRGPTAPDPGARPARGGRAPSPALTVPERPAAWGVALGRPPTPTPPLPAAHLTLTPPLPAAHPTPPPPPPAAHAGPRDGGAKGPSACVLCSRSQDRSGQRVGTWVCLKGHTRPQAPWVPEQAKLGCRHITFVSLKCLGAHPPPVSVPGCGDPSCGSWRLGG